MWYDQESVNEEDAYYLRSDLFEWLYQNNRIRLYGDCMAWIRDIQSCGFNFSFGSRIHGNVVSLLAGIPAYIGVQSARVRELAEFFNIPHSIITDREEKPDVYALYERADYSLFNASFHEKFVNFVTWFREHELPCFEDMDYIEREVSKLEFPQPYYRTSLEFIHHFTQLHKKMYKGHFTT